MSTTPQLDPAVAAAITAIGEGYMPVLVGTPPTDVVDEHWTRFDRATTAEALADRLAAMLPQYEHDGTVATAFLCSRFMSPLALLAGRPVVTQRRGLVLDPSALWLRRHPRGWHNGIALAAPRLLVTDDDPLAGRPGTQVVGDLAALRSAAVAAVLSLATPVLDRLLRVGQLGERALWGQLADMLVTAAARPHDGTGDADRARAEADALLACDPRLWVEPTIARVEVDGGCGLAWRRGSCCLAYRLDRFAYCTGCPLVDEDEWWERSVASVRERVGGAA